MQRSPVVSTHLASIGYDATTQTMEIEFQNGSVYTYTGVTPQIHHDLVTAESVGSHFLKNVRPNFQGTQAKKTSGSADG